MIKIEKCLMLGGELGLLDDDRYYLYRGLDTKANIYAEVIARKEDIDKSKKFEKQVKDRVKFVIKKIFWTNDGKNDLHLMDVWEIKLGQRITKGGDNDSPAN